MADAARPPAPADRRARRRRRPARRPSSSSSSPSAAVAGPLARIAAVDASLADQLRRAAQSVALNLGESGGRAGRDRVRFYRYAHGSLLEARTALAVARVSGYVAAAEVAAAEQLGDRLGGLIYRLTR